MTKNLNQMDDYTPNRKLNSTEKHVQVYKMFSDYLIYTYLYLQIAP